MCVHVCVHVCVCVCVCVCDMARAECSDIAPLPTQPVRSLSCCHSGIPLAEEASQARERQGRVVLPRAANNNHSQNRSPKNPSRDPRIERIDGGRGHVRDQVLGCNCMHVARTYARGDIPYSRHFLWLSRPRQMRCASQAQRSRPPRCSFTHAHSIHVHCGRNVAGRHRRFAHVLEKSDF